MYLFPAPQTTPQKVFISCVHCIGREAPDRECFCRGTGTLDGLAELDILIDTMDFPLDKRNDLPWLGRNLSHINPSHKNLPKVQNVLGQLIAATST